MSNYKAHVWGGVAAYGIILYLFLLLHILDHPSLFQLLFWFICVIAGSLFPDIDIKSRGQQYFYRLLFLVLLFCMNIKHFTAVCACGVIAIVPLLVKHRGLFHQLWFLISAPFLLSFFLIQLFPYQKTNILTGILFFVIGCVSHLWLDFKPHVRIRKRLGN